MPAPNEKLAVSLELLRRLQGKIGIVAIKSTHLSRVHRERLIKNQFLKSVMKGWYVVSNPEEKKGESTSWFVSYWQFCGQYLEELFKGEYVLSAEQSISLHAGDSSIPKQLMVKTKKATNYIVTLMFDTSIAIYKGELPEKKHFTKIDDIKVQSLPMALINCTSQMYLANPTDMRTALSQIRDASEVLEILLNGSHSTIAGRLAGAFRNIGNDKIANHILSAMAAADYQVREEDPFDSKSNVNLSLREKSPYVNRIKLLWHDYRKEVIKHFPAAPAKNLTKNEYLKLVDEIYTTDAYHSLSIEKYVVSRELVDAIRNGTFDTETEEEHKRSRDAMAAKGYWEASQLVKESIGQILDGGNSGKITDADHQEWYQGLFKPSVSAGIIKQGDLAGYRSDQVYISNSKHVPLNVDALRDSMPILFELIEQEAHAGVRATLGHFIFTYIHPYKDGNGRMGRFLMNTLLASGGYPWTVIPVEKREEYMAALETASVEKNFEPFAKFISTLVDNTLKGKPDAS